MTEYPPGATAYRYWVVNNDQAEIVDGGVIDETLLTIYVNMQEVATIMCSPVDEQALVMGFLYNEEVIDSADAIGLLRLNVARSVADVFLKRSDFTPPRRMTITSGCGGGVTWQALSDTHPPLETDYVTTTAAVMARMQDLHREAALYNVVRGVHTAVLANDEQLLLITEDVGRHNTVDKIAGKALMTGLPTQNHILLTSGRISSEMLNKARRMGVPVVASRTGPTSFAVQLAALWNICVVGYVRGRNLRVYTHPQRVGLG